MEFKAAYLKTFGKHTLDATFVYTQRKGFSEFVSAGRKNYISTWNMSSGEFTYELFSIIMEVSNGKTKEEEIIDYMNSQLEPGLQGMVSSTYFGFVKNILDKLSGSGAATGLFSSVLSGVVYYFDTLANVIPTLSLAGLYYSYQMRKAERLGIYYGLKPRP